MRAFIQILWIKGFFMSWIGCLKCTKTHLKITKKKSAFKTKERWVG